MSSSNNSTIKDKVPSLILFLVSNLFTKKLNAIGIANLPVAIRTFRKQDTHKLYRYSLSIFHGSVVASGLFNFFPSIIQLNAVMNIVIAVKDSISMRKEESKRLKELSSKEERPIKSMSETAKAFFFGNPKQPPERKLSTNEEKAQEGCRKAKQILGGKRESATDDIIWGVLQVSFVFFNQTYLRVLWHAWIAFLLTILEEAVFNPKLDRKQKGKRIVWVLVTSYLSGKYVF